MLKEYIFDFRNKEMKESDRIFGVGWLQFQSKPDRTQHAYNKA